MTSCFTLLRGWSHSDLISKCIVALLLFLSFVSILIGAESAFALDVTTTLDDGLQTDGNMNNNPDPGDTLRYTLIISNTDVMDASGVIADITLDANLMFVLGSIHSTPISRKDLYSALENTPLVAPATGVLMNDSDLDGDALVVSGSDTASASGAIVLMAADGSFTYTPGTIFDYLAPNQSATDTFSYTIQDASGNLDSASVCVVVNGVNDAPSFLKGADQSAFEDSGVHTVNNWATSIDQGNGETGQILTFNITGNTNPSLFASGPSISALGTLSYETASDAVGTATITVELKDDGGTANGGADTSASQSFQITINPVNDAPSFVKGLDQGVLEDSGPQVVNPWATALSKGPADESSQTLTFMVTGNTNPGLFAAGPAVSSTGVLTFTPAGDEVGAASITLVVKDDGGTANGGVDTSAAQSFIISVTPVNDAPSFVAGPDQIVLEDSGPQTVDPWATGISPGPSDESGQTVSFMMTGNTNPGLFSAGPVFSSTGLLTYTPANDASGTATVSLKVTDSGGTANGGVDTSTPQSFDIMIQGVNDPPAFVKGSDVDYAGPTVLHTEAGWATGISPGPANEAGQVLVFSATNDNPGIFTTQPAVNALSGDLTFTPALAGVASVTLTLMDNGGTANGGGDLSSPQIFTITVTLQAPPAAVADPNYVVATGATLNVPAGATDVLVNDNLGIPAGELDSFGGGNLGGAVTDNASGTVVSPISGYTNGSLKVNGDGSFTFTPPTTPTAFSGPFTFVYRLRNSAGVSDATVTVNVLISPTAVDDTVAGGSNPGDKYHTPLNTALNISDGSDDLLFNDTVGSPSGEVDHFGGGDLGGAVTGNASGTIVSPLPSYADGSLQVNGDGSLSFTPPTNFTGLYTFDYQIRNTIGSDVGTVTLAAGARPQAVTDTYASSLVGNVSIDTTVSTGFSVLTNDSGDQKTVSLNSDTNGTATVNSNGTFTFNPDPGYEGAASFTYNLTNGFGTVTGTVSLTVNEVIWFVDNEAMAGGDGRIGTPFNELTGAGSFDATAADESGDNIFLYADATSYAGGLTLLNNQKLIGQGATVSLATAAGVTFPADSNPPATGLTNPTVTNASGVGVTLGSTNTIRGLSFGNCSSHAITGTSFGTLTVNDCAINNGDDQALNLNTGTLSATFSSVSSTNSAAQGINLVSCAGSLTMNGGSITGAVGVPFVVNGGTLSSTYSGGITQAANNAMVSISGGHTTGTITFQSGALSATNGTGLQFDNADSTSSYNFNGTTTLNGGDAGIDILNGSAGTFTFGTGCTITSPNGIAFNVDGGMTASTASVTYSGSMTQANNFAMVNVINHSGGTITFQTGTLSATNGTGLQFNNADSASAYNFNGTTTLNGGDAGIDILNGSAGTFTFGSNTSITNPSGTDVNINSSNGNVTYNGTITDDFGSLVTIASCGGGTKDFNGTISDGDDGDGNGISLTSNTGTTINFDGGLTLSTGANAAFTATGGGTVNVTDPPATDNKLTTTTATALNVANTTIGASGLTFVSISANGATNGILLNSTGASGGLTVTGTGTTDATGGTIQNTTNRGASFISASNITLKNMNFTSAGTLDLDADNSGLSTGDNLATNAAIHLQTVTNVTLDNLNITGGAEQGINGNAVTTFALANSSLLNTGNGPDEDGIHFYNMLGTSSITNTSIASSGDDNVNVQSQSGTGTITISGGSANTGVLGSGYLFGVRGTSNITVDISNVTSNNNFSGGVVADGFDTATLNLTLTGSVITNNNDGVQVSANNGTSRFDIDNNDFTGNDFLAITVLKAAFSTTGVLEGAIRNNNPITIGNGQATDAISVFQAGGGDLEVSITNNVISYAGTQRAILMQAGQDGNGNLAATVTGNSVDILLDGVGNAVAGILAQSAITGPGSTSALCADLGGAGGLSNTFTHSLGGSVTGGDIRVRQRNNGTVRLPGYAGSATDTAAVAAYLSGRNTVVTAPTATFDSTGFTGGAACAQPTLP